MDTIVISGVDAQGNTTLPVEDRESLKVNTQPTTAEDKGDAPKQKPRKARNVSPPPSDSDKIEDPVALKLESALKRSIADRTGNLALKEEAAREQSRADKLGARAGLTKQQHERAKKEAEQLRAEAAVKQSLADRTGDVALKKEAAAQQHLADKLIANANKALSAHEKAEALAREQSGEAAPAPQPAQPAASATGDSMKNEASIRQSEADKSGDEKLKRAAAKEQSRADKARAAALKIQGGEPLSLLRNASAIDVSLNKVKGTPMSKQKSANNVSLPKMPAQADDAAAPAPASALQPLPLTRQKSACDASIRNSNNKGTEMKKEKGMLRAKSGNDVALKSTSPNSWSANKAPSKWASPSQTHVKFMDNPNSPKWPQSRWGMAQKKEAEPKSTSPMRSDAPSWRQSEMKPTLTPTAPASTTSTSTSTTMDKVIVPTAAKKNKVDASTNTEFDPELLAEGEAKI